MKILYSETGKDKNMRCFFCNKIASQCAWTPIVEVYYCEKKECKKKGKKNIIFLNNYLQKRIGGDSKKSNEKK